MRLRFMQLQQSFERNTSPLAHLCALILALLPSLVPANETATALEQIQDHLGRTLRQFVAAQAEEFGRRVEFEIGQLDPRLNLAFCDRPLRDNFDPLTRPGRVAIKVECDGSRPWSLFVPVQIQAWQQVVVTSAALARGQQISESDVTLAEAELSSLRSGYLSRIEDAAGLIVRRNLEPGAPLHAGLLEQPQVVKRGDEVIIRADNAIMSVQVPGIALSDGRAGEQVNVRNLSSNRVIRAIVVDVGEVRVPL